MEILILLHFTALIVILMALAVLPSLRRDVSRDRVDAELCLSESRFAELLGWRVHYTDQGSKDGKVLVLIHGTASSLHTFNRCAAILAEHHRVIRFDIPGFGLTGQGRPKEYSLATDAAALAALLDKLDVGRPVTVVGNSLGGRVAWEFALSYPDRVDSLVLIDSVSFPWPEKPPAIALPGLPVVGLIFRWLTPEWFVRWSTRQVFGNPALATDEVVRRYLALLLREGNREALIRRVRVDLEHQSRRLAELNVPVLILWGEKDRWVPPHHAYQHAQAIRDSRLILYPGLGHIPQEEAPAEVASDILSFLENS